MVITKTSAKVTTTRSIVPAGVLPRKGIQYIPAKLAVYSLVAKAAVALRHIVEGMNPFAKQMTKMTLLLSSGAFSTTQKLGFVKKALQSGNIDLQLTALELVEKQAQLARQVAIDTECRKQLVLIATRKVNHDENYLKNESYINQAKLRTMAVKLLPNFFRVRRVCRAKTPLSMRVAPEEWIAEARENCVRLSLVVPSYFNCISRAMNAKAVRQCLTDLAKRTYPGRKN